MVSFDESSTQRKDENLADLRCGELAGYPGLESMVHIAEEMTHAGRDLPKAIMATVIVGFFKGVALKHVDGHERFKLS